MSNKTFFYYFSCNFVIIKVKTVIFLLQNLKKSGIPRISSYVTVSANALLVQLQGFMLKNRDKAMHTHLFCFVK